MFIPFVGLMINMDYDEMLDRAFSEGEMVDSDDIRFDPPSPKVQKEGASTILVNSKKIADYVNRDMDEIVTFLQQELGTNASIDEDNNRVHLKGDFDKDDVGRSIDNFVEMFVLCEQCGSPDTFYEEQKGVEIVRCSACGASNAKAD